MAENNKEKKMKTGVFMSEDTKEYYVAGMHKSYNSGLRSEKNKQHNSEQSIASKTAAALKTNSIVRNTAICAFAVRLVWGIASAGSPSEDAAAIREVIAHEYNEEDIGELKFVSSVIDETAAAEEELEQNRQINEQTAEEEAAFVYPLDGIVTTTFAQSGSGATITAMDTREVVSSRDGEVYEVSDNFIRILNNDGSVTTYFGVESSRSVGESVCAGNIIGELLSDVLYVEQDVGGKKEDPFA